MKRVKIAEFKDQLSAHLRAVEKGAELEITDRKRPIVRLVPISDDTRSFPMIEPVRPFSEIRSKAYNLRSWSVDPVELLMEERGKK